MEAFFNECNDKELEEKLKDIQVISAHMKKETLLRFLKGSKNCNKMLKSLISDVVREYVICKNDEKDTRKAQNSFAQSEPAN